MIPMYLFNTTCILILCATAEAIWSKTLSFSGWKVKNNWTPFYVRGHLECMLLCVHEQHCLVIHYNVETRMCMYHNKLLKVSIEDGTSTDITTFVRDRGTLLILNFNARFSDHVTAQTSCEPIRARLITLSELQAYHDNDGQTVCTCGWLADGERRFVTSRGGVECGSNTTTTSAGLHDCSYNDKAFAYCVLLD